MRDVLPVIFLVAFGIILLLLTLLVVVSHLRRLRRVQEWARTDWTTRTAELEALVNVRRRRRDGQETGMRRHNRQGSTSAGAA